MTEDRRYFGKHRGTVVDNLDEQGIARLRVVVPETTGALVVVALPCLPFAGPSCGLFALPVPGSHVWIEYEKGDLNAPIWTGCFWQSRSELPNQVKPGPGNTAVLQVPGGAALVLSDDPQRSIVLRTSDGSELVFNAQGITLTTGKGAVVALTGMSVDINRGALKVD